METRFFRQDERDLMLASIDRLWSHNHVYVRKPEVLEHLVLNTPYREEFAGKDNYSYIGMWDDEGEVVGLLGAMPQEMNAFGETHPSNTFTTWIVNKDKHKNINGLDMVTFAFQQKQPGMLVNIGVSEYAYNLYKYIFKCYAIKDMPRWIAVNRVQETVEHLLPNADVLPYLPRLQPLEFTPAKYRLVYDQLDAGKWNKFYTEKFAPVSIGTKRDYKFLQWRYMQSPILKYNFITVEDEQGIQGLAVVRIEPIMNGAYSIGRVLEFMALEAEPSVLLANAIARYAPDVLMWDFYCLSDITAFGLEAVGFRKLPVWLDKTMMPTRFQPVDYECLKLRMAVGLSDELKETITPVDTYQWYITKGDADQDRAN